MEEDYEMKRSNLLFTTAIAALLAAPAVAQDTGSGAQTGEPASVSSIGSYSVADVLGLIVTASDGEEIGPVEAIVEGEDGALVLVRLNDRTVALPLGSVSLSEDGQALTTDRNLDDVEQMASYEADGELTLETDTMLSDAMGSAAPDFGTDANDSQVAEGGEPLTDTETDTEVAEGEQPIADTNADTDVAEGDATMPDMQSDTEVAEGDATMPETESGTDMADAGTPGQQEGISGFVNMTVGDILGMRVIGANGNDVGEIDYIYQSASEGYMAVIGIGGFLGLGEHTVALPLGDFSVDSEQSALLLDGRTNEELEAMQEVDESTLEALPDDHVIGA
jgi:ribosomal 30S subunit maturation factor RimM